jgi:hypothetical protein
LLFEFRYFGTHDELRAFEHAANAWNDFILYTFVLGAQIDEGHWVEGARRIRRAACGGAVTLGSYVHIGLMFAKFAFCWQRGKT